MGEADRQRCVGRQWADANACLSSGLLGSPRPTKGHRSWDPVPRPHCSGAPPRTDSVILNPSQLLSHHASCPQGNTAA